MGRGEFCCHREVSLLPELAGEGVAEEDLDAAWVGGSTSLTLFGVGAVADGFG